MQQMQHQMRMYQGQMSVMQQWRQWFGDESPVILTLVTVC